MGMPLKAGARFESAPHPILHPSHAARTEAGVAGELHPELLDGTWSLQDSGAAAPTRRP